MTEYRALVKEGHKVIRILSKKADSVVLHMQDTDDKDYILRIYSQEKKVYRVLTQRAFENMPYIRETYIKDEFFDSPEADTSALTRIKPKLDIVYEDENIMLLYNQDN